MSIIEKAIDKLNAPKSSDGTLEPDESKASVQALPDTSSSAAKLGSSAVIAPVAKRQEAEEIPLSTNRLEVTERVAAKKQPEDDFSDIDNHPNSNDIFIDFDHLLAAGLMTPSVRNTSQAEEYQHVKRRLLGNMVPGMSANMVNPNLIMVTSSVPGEGKTYTCVNLAMSMAAEVDRTVLVIDTDMAKKDLTRTFGATGKRGFYDLLSDSSLNVSDVLLHSNIANFSLIPAGLGSEINTALLSSSRMQELTSEIGKRYSDRVVIFDTAPVLASSAALAFAPLIGQIVLIVEAANTKQETLQTALELLEDVPVTGVILNKSRQSRSSRGYYGYYYTDGAV